MLEHILTQVRQSRLIGQGLGLAGTNPRLNGALGEKPSRTTTGWRPPERLGHLTQLGTKRSKALGRVRLILLDEERPRLLQTGSGVPRRRDRRSLAQRHRRSVCKQALELVFGACLPL